MCDAGATLRMLCNTLGYRGKRTGGLQTGFNDLRDTPGADLRSDVVVHLVCVHFSDCEEVHQGSILVRGEKEALTRQPALGGRERHIVRCQAREPNSFVQVLHRSSASLLDSGCSLLSDLLIHGKPGLHVFGEVVLVREDNTKRRSIFDSLTCPLGLMRLIEPQSLSIIHGAGGCNSPSLGALHPPECTPCPYTNTRTVGVHTTSRACGQQSA